MFRRLATIAVLSLAIATSAFAASAKPRHIAIQVDQNDPQVMNLVLNNATNVIEYYRAKKQDVDIDIVAYGPGLHMLRADTSPVRDRISGSRIWRFRARCSFRPATTPSRAWRRPKGMRFPSCPRQRSFPRGSST